MKFQGGNKIILEVDAWASLTMWTSVLMQVKVQMLEQQLADAQEAATRSRPMRPDDAELQKGREEIENALAMNQKLEEELSKRDELIEVCSLFKMNGWMSRVLL